MSSFFKSKGFFWGIIIVAVGAVGYFFYVTNTVKNEASAAASNLENGGIGTTISSNINTFVGGLWTGVKNFFSSSTTSGAIPGTSTTLTS
ncbi:MAG: hypothetical protein ACREL1_00380 [bacterium]